MINLVVSLVIVRANELSSRAKSDPQTEKRNWDPPIEANFTSCELPPETKNRPRLGGHGEPVRSPVKGCGP